MPSSNLSRAILMALTSSLLFVVVGCEDDSSETNSTAAAGSGGTAGSGGSSGTNTGGTGAQLTGGSAGSGGSAGQSGSSGSAGSGAQSGSSGASGSGGNVGGTGGSAGGSSGSSGSSGTGGSMCDAPLSGDPVDAADPCKTLTADGAPEARIAWAEDYNQELMLETATEFLWGFQYAITHPVDNSVTWAIEYEMCEHNAGSEEFCSVGELPAPEGFPEPNICTVAFGPKYGVDPSQYMPGFNQYRFTLRLIKDGCSVSEDSFTIDLTYTPM